LSTSWQRSLSVVMPADAGTPGDATCARTVRPAGWRRAEDSQPGQPGFTLPDAQASTSVIDGYLDRSSVACGDTVGVHLAGANARVQVKAFRIGAYRRGRARLVWTSATVATAPEPLPPLIRVTHLREPAWPATLTVHVTPQWPPGFYLLVPTVAGAAVGPAIPLVVRDDAGHEPVLFAASTLTWNAYNDWGGYSLYRGPGRSLTERYARRARVATLRRPLVGAGYRQLAFMDLPVIQRVEASGLDAAYTTDVDVDRRPSQLMQHAELVLGGHSEYWTRREYDAMVAARNAGINVAFFGANNLWWHARIEVGGPDGTSLREAVWRDFGHDQVFDQHTSDDTMLWSQWPEHRDGAAVLGQSHAAIGVHGGYQIMAAPGWLLAGSGLRKGSVLPLAVGNEADGYTAAAANPPNLTVVAAGVLRGAGGPVTVSAGYYSAPSGAAVFAAGSTDWACGLQGPCVDQVVPATTVRALDALTGNILTAFSRVRAGSTHPSQLNVPPPTLQLMTRLAPQALGTYGGSEAAEEAGNQHTLQSGGHGDGALGASGTAGWPVGGARRRAGVGVYSIRVGDGRMLPAAK
jgi:hypothetical protein